MAMEALPYTADQEEAISSTEGNLQVIACAGSGKTQVISERVAVILERGWQAGVRPRNIVAFTFTDRAAAALKDRIGRCIERRLGKISGLAEMYVGTIHGYCLGMLQGNVPEYFKYQVLTEVQTKLLIDRNSVQSGLKHAGLRRYVESELFISVLNVLREGYVDWSLLADHPMKHALAMYRELLTKKRYLDYTSIMEKAVELTESDAGLRRQLADTVKYVIVDEYQDVNPLQERLTRALYGLGAQLCVVGDDDQTLYQFRGTDIRNIIDFEKRYPSVKRVAITDNFRSSSGVVDLARDIISLNADRLDKQMVSASHQAFDRGDILCQSFRDPAAEAAWIAETVKSMIGLPFVDEPGKPARGLSYSDFAVLLRSVRGNAGPILEALRSAQVPSVVVGYNNLFDRPEVQAAVGLFGYIIGEVDEHILEGLWSAAGLSYKPKDWTSAVSIMKLRRSWPASERRSLYTLQRTLLDFLTALRIREERVPGEAGEIIFYNLGKFSQVISDFEQIHFHSEPQEKHKTFYDFLTHQAANYYPEGAQEQSLVRPDAVQVMTVHQAKGLEWPVVFVPALLRNRFPAAGVGGKSVWHVIPAAAVANASDYRGGVEEERRVLYVALTRSQKYLYCSFAPIPDNKRFRHPSAFVGDVSRSGEVLTRPPARPEPQHLEPQQKSKVVNLNLSFSQFKYFKECPYQFKLRFLYGFNAPIAEALGYGKSLHDSLAEIHKRSLAGDIPADAEVPAILDRHLHVPFAYPALREKLRASGGAAIARYVDANRSQLDRLEHAEQVIELDLGDGIVVDGRIDLIRRIDTGETAIVDFKSNERSQDEDVTRVQLHIYTVGYRDLTGKSADLIEVHELEKGRVVVREEVNPELEARTLGDIREAAKALRANQLPRLATWTKTCVACDLRGLCRDTPHG
jgi:DNA helicase-2/ATP-dependent DNA helicase PcrA